MIFAMLPYPKRLMSGLCTLIFFSLLITSIRAQDRYLCPPCACPAHGEQEEHFEADGQCPHCAMALYMEPTLFQAEDFYTRQGTGSFLLPKGSVTSGSPVAVFYHKPARFTPESPILIVLPGSGRDAVEYRDQLISASTQYGVLILALYYQEEDFPFEAYHLGGIVRTSNLLDQVTYVKNSNQAWLDERGIRIEVDTQSRNWIFADFDRVFDLVAQATQSKQTQYDVYGHSAGGQILHRMALLQPESKAHRIVAANAGFYTLPDLDTPLPFGLQGTGINAQQLGKSFQQRLTLLLGEKDNATEQGGILLRSTTVDQQGLHRFERGQYFLQFARAQADALDQPLNWTLKVVQDVGHDFKAMGAAAIEYLYGD